MPTIHAKNFEWDQGNIEKNFFKHKLSYIQIEEVFFNTPLLIFDDFEHSKTEPRMYALGHDNKFNLLTITFTIRENRVRVISARPMSVKERRRYEKDI